MKKTNTTQRNNKFLRLGANVLLLSLLFVFVFAGVLSASFVVEENAIENGQIEADVADAAGSWDEGVSSFDSGITSYNVWDKVDFGTLFGASDNRNRTLSATGDLKTFIEKGVVRFRLFHHVESKSKKYTFTFTVKQNNNSGTQMLSQSHTLDTDNKDYTSGWYDNNTVSTFYFYCSSGGSSTAWSDVRNIRIEFQAKTYTITINNQSPTSEGSTSLGVTGGSAVSNISRSYKTGYTLKGYYTGTSGSGTKVFNADGTPNKGTAYIDSSGRWIKNESPTVYAYWVANKGTITYNKNAPSGKTVNGTIATNGVQTIYYNESFTIAASGYTVSDGSYTLVGWSETSTAQVSDSAYTLGKVYATSATHSAPYKLSSDNDAFAVTLYAVWKQSDFGCGGSKTDGTWGSSSNPFLIETEQHLINIYTIINTGESFDSVNGHSFDNSTTNTFANSTTFEGCYFKVTGTNITVSSNLFNPIGEAGASKQFKAAEFDGNNKTITLSISRNLPYVGLFGYTNGTKIKNLTIAGNVTSTSAADTKYTGGIVAYMNGGSMEGCNKGASSDSPKSKVEGNAYVGGLVGYSDGGNIKNCYNYANVTCAGLRVGGIVAYTTGKLEGCQNHGEVKSNYSSGSYDETGGIVAYSKNEIKNCENHGAVTGRKQQVGGIVGYMTGTSASFAGTNKNYGTVTGVDEVGGIAGGISNNLATIAGCENEGQVIGDTKVGGIIGAYTVSSSTISGCTNKGAIGKSGAVNVGGIAGYTLATISRCTNYSAGTVTGASQLGGIVGNISSGTSTILGCSNQGNVTGTGQDAGGIAGVWAGTIKGCTNTANVKTATNSGGILGRTATAGINVNHCYITTGTIGQSGVANVGGIIGNLAVTSSTVQYCVNDKSTVTGASGSTGAILGTNTSNPANVFTSCFAINNVAQGFSGTANTTYTPTGCWSIYRDASHLTGNNPKAAVLPSIDSAYLIPYTSSGSSPSPTTWPNTATLSAANANPANEPLYNIDGFAVKIAKASGHYFSSRTSATTNVNNNYFTPTSVLKDYDDADGVTVLYEASLGNLGATLYVSDQAITTNGFTTAEYNNAPQGIAVTVPISAPYSVVETYGGASYTATGVFRELPVSPSYTGTVRYFMKISGPDGSQDPNDYYETTIEYADHWLDDSATPMPTAAGSYTHSAVVYLNGEKIGVVAQANFTITKRVFTVSNLWMAYESEATGLTTQNNTNFKYKGIAQGLSHVYVKYNNNTDTYADLTSNATIQNAVFGATPFKINNTYYGDPAVKFSSGSFKATNAGNYTFKIELNDTTNYALKYGVSGSEVNSITFSFTIAARSLTTNASMFAFGYSNEATQVTNSGKAKDVQSWYQNNNDWSLNYSSVYATANQAQSASPALVYIASECPDYFKLYFRYDSSSSVYALTASTNTYSSMSVIGDIYDDTTIEGRNFEFYYEDENTPGLYHLYEGVTKSALVMPSQFYKRTSDMNNDFYIETVTENDVDMGLKGFKPELKLGNMVLQAGDTVGSKDVTVKLTGRGNYAGSVYVRYTVMRSDFGGDFLKSQEGTKNYDWGTSNNPFIIETYEHLLRLSAIVNGADAWNSLTSLNDNVAPSITATSYQNGYFKFSDELGNTLPTLVANLDTGFVPIGRDSNHYFAGWFNGNKSGSYDRIKLNLQGADMNYVGLFGYTSGATLFNFELKPATSGSINMTGTSDYVGSLVGYAANNTRIYDVINRVNVTGHDYVGGVVGYGAVNISGTSNTILVRNYGAVSGNENVGGILGYAVGSMVGVVNDGTVEGNKAVGGLVGRATASIKLNGNQYNINNGNVTGGSDTWTGGIVGYYQPAAANHFTGLKVANNLHVTGGTGNYTGGFFGILSSSYVQTLGDNNEITISGLQVSSDGAYVGGLVGQYSSGSKLFTIKNIKLSGASTVTAEGKNYVGGIIGYGKYVTLDGVKFIAPSGSSTWSIVGSSYVGGLAGMLASGGQNEITNASRVNTNVSGVSYVGGYVGKFETTKAINFTPILRYNGASPSTAADLPSNRTYIKGKNYVGSLFGYVVGTGYENNDGNTANDSMIKIGASNGYTNVYACVMNNGASGSVVGGLVGYAAKVAIALESNIDTGYYFKVNTKDTVNSQNKGGVFNSSATVNYWGGLVGILGENANIVSVMPGGYFSATAWTTVSGVGNYVGGIVGFVTPKAGSYLSSDSTIFGNTVKFNTKYSESTGSITATGNFVGGLIGFMGVDSQSINADIGSHVVLPSGVLASDRAAESPYYPKADGNTVLFNPTYNATNALFGTAQNEQNISGKNYVGGLIGCVAADDTSAFGARIEFENAQLPGAYTTLSGDIAVYSGTNDSKIKASGSSGTYGRNVGGLVGAITGAQNTSTMTRVFASGANTGDSYGDCGVWGVQNVGGLVGRLEGNTEINNSFFATITRNVNTPYSYSHVVGTTNVGGLVGFMTGGLLKNSVGLGMTFKDVSAQATKSGVVGSKNGGTITDSWAIYHKAYVDPVNNATEEQKKGTTAMPYTDYIDESRGRGVIIISGYSSGGASNLVYNFVPTFEEVAQMVGLMGSVAANKQEVTKELAGGAGYISVACGLPNFASLTCHQLVIYNATGNEETYSIDEFAAKDSTNNVVYLKLAMSKKSFSIAIQPITFKNVPPFSGTNNSTAAKKNLTDHYIAPANDAAYKATADKAYYDNKTGNETINNGYISHAEGITYIKNSGFKIGEYNKDFDIGSQETPYIISTKGQWTSFAQAVRGGTSYEGKYVKLTTNLTGSNKVSSSELAGDYTTDGQTKDNHTINFRGTFDGDGHTIEVNASVGGSSGARLSLFPNAAGATFKNLTVSGTIKTVTSESTGDTDSESGNHTVSAGQSNGWDVAGFVGKPFGSVKFVNCTNSAAVTGYRNVGGFVGFVSDGLTVTIIDCINKGAMRSYEAAGAYSDSDQPNVGDAVLDFDGGTGGFIGNVKGNTVLDSCRNDGTVRGPQNLGGIVGRSTKTLNIYNCANTGAITGDSGYNTDANEASNVTVVAQYLWSYCAYEQKGTYNCLNYVGGIVGKTAGSSAALNMYGCYNEATITAYGSIAGGLVGSVGTYKPLKSWFGGNPDQTDCGVDSTIAYCYNKGLVQTGGDSNKCIQGWMTNGVNRTSGSMAGGIVGVFGSGKIAYCYNTADVIAHGGDGYAGLWVVRVGGIVAHAQPAGSNGSYRTITITECYNTGLIQAPATRRCAAVSTWPDNALKMGGSIMGFIDWADYSSEINAALTITNCYSAPNCYYNAKRESGKKYSNLGTYDNTDQMSSGRICSLADMTALMRSDGAIAPDGNWIAGGQVTGKGSASGHVTASSAATLIDSNGNSIKNTSNEFSPQYNSSFKAGTLNGWVYIYGCLPQLAIFTLGTKKSMSMLSTSYGRNMYQEFVPQQAGGQYSPYIIRDGIHLMGMTALTSASVGSCYYDFNKIYVDFANSSATGDVQGESNNVKNETVLGINLPVDANDDYKYNENNVYIGNAYKGITTPTGSSYVTGKSYFLFEKGAVISQGDLVAGDSKSYNNKRTAWQNKNYYYNSDTATSMSSGATIETSRLWPISYVGHKTLFMGTLNAHGGLVKGVNIQIGGTTGMDVGLFTKVSNATIKNLAVSGSIKAYTNSTNSSHVVSVGGIVGRAGAGTKLEGCSAGYDDSNALTVVANASGYNPSGYVGGIAGVADTAGYDKNGTAQNVTGAEINFINCEVKNATINTFKNSVGGIVGYATSTQNTESGNTTVNITGCKVSKATIQTTAGKTDDACGTKAGGIIGAQDNLVSLNISSCSVGTSQLTPQNTASVTIKGEHSIGGVIGVAGRHLTIEDTKVFGETEIKRATWGSTVTNSSNYGTAIGGLIGYTPSKSDAGGETPNILLKGSLLFAGKITATTATSNSGYVESVGGVVGYFGEGAQFMTGSTIYIVGTIDTASLTNVQNIGGAVGQVANAAFSGNFYAAPTITATNGVNVGGFIGTATGRCTILPDNVNIQIGGNIQAKQYVGGFIGYIGQSAKLDIGPSSYGGKPYNGSLNITIDDALSFTLTVGNSTTTKTCEPTIITASNGYVGGIVGANKGVSANGGGIAIYKGNIKNEGQVVSGTVSITGSGNNRTVTINSRKDYAGGLIGLNQGAFTISGATLENSGNVDGDKYVGGSIGALALGNITGTAQNRVIFKNTGAVDGNKYVGGAIGILANNVSYANFLNGGTVKSSSSATNKMAIGGAIGYIGWVNDAFGAAPANFAVSYSHIHAEYSSTTQTLNLSVTGGAGSDVGGVGGVIGIISAQTTWGDGNTFYVAGDVTASNVVNVGGTVGLIQAANVEITNMLAYDTKVEGYDNVGGIVGNINGNDAVILNSFNVTVTPTKGVYYHSTAATVYYGGIVGKANLADGHETDASTSYWVKAYNNDELAELDIDSITDLGKRRSITLDGTTMDQSFFENHATPHDWKSTITEGVTWNTYLTVTRAGDIPDGFTVQPHNVETEDGNYTYYDYENGSFKAFSTGTENTGWYFVYSYDSRFQVNTTYNSEVEPNNYEGNYYTYNGSSYTEAANGEFWKDGNTYKFRNGNLSFWKYIAQCYSDDEAGWGSSWGAVTSSAIVYSGTYSSNGDITSGTNGDYLHAYADAPSVSGYYLYAEASGTGLEKVWVAGSPVRLFVKIDKTSTAVQNVAVYYRVVNAGKALVYNGAPRYAPISVDMPFSENETQAKALSEQYTYLYNASQAYPTNAGNYTTSIDIYYSPTGTASIFKVGYITSMSWQIKTRDIKTHFAGTNGTYGATNGYEGDGIAPSTMANSIKVTLTNISPLDNEDYTHYLNFKFVVKKDNVDYGSPVYFNTRCLTNANLDDNESYFYVTYGSSYSTEPVSAEVRGLANTSTGAVTANTVVNVDHTFDPLSHARDQLSTTVSSEYHYDNKIRTYILVFHFKNAGQYSVTVTTDTQTPQGISGNNVKTNYKAPTPANGSATVNKRVLSINGYTEAGQHDYDGDSYSNQFYIGSGTDLTSSAQWKSEDDLFYKDSNDVVHGIDDFGLAILWDKLDNAHTTVSTSIAHTSASAITNVAPFTFTEMHVTTIDGPLHNGIDVNGFKNYGDYYLYVENTETADGNYQLNTTGLTAYSTGYRLKLYGISDNAISVTWTTTTAQQRTKEYNKAVGSVTVTFTATKSLKYFADTVNEYFDIYRLSSGNTQDTGDNRAPKAECPEIEISGTPVNNVLTVTLNTGTYSNGQIKDGVNAGSYYFFIYGNGDSNIAITFTNGSYHTEHTVTRLDYTITKKALSLSYTWKSGGNAQHEYVYTTGDRGVDKIDISGLLSGDSVGCTSGSTNYLNMSVSCTYTNFDNQTVVEYVTSPVTGSANGTAKISVQNCKKVGTYTLTFAGFTSTNYSLTPLPGAITWEITKRPVQLVSVTGGSGVYKNATYSPGVTVTCAGTNHNLSDGNFTFTYGTDTLAVTVNYTDISGDNDQNRRKMRDVGKYSITIGGIKYNDSGDSALDNYTFSGNASAEFTVTKKEITATFTGTGDSGAETYTAGDNVRQNYTYNGNYKGVEKVTVTGLETGDTLQGARGVVVTPTNVTGAYNAANYTLTRTVDASNPESLTVHSVSISCLSGTYASNYSLSSSSTKSASWTIAPLAITVPSSNGWTNSNHYNYSGAAQSPTITSIVLGGSVTRNRLNTTYDSENDLFKERFNGIYPQPPQGESGEFIVLHISRDDAENKDGSSVGEYTARVVGFSVEGGNVIGHAYTSNYTFTLGGEELDADFEIIPAIITVSLAPQQSTITKVYNRSATAPSGRYPTITFGYPVGFEGDEISDEDVTLSNGSYRNDANTADDYNVAWYNGSPTSKMMRYKVTISDSNFAFAIDLEAENPYDMDDWVSGYIGMINPRPVTIDLNMRSGKAYKVYDGNATFATWSSGQATSNNYRSGRGFSVEAGGVDSGVVSGDAITITATFAESASGRSTYDAYVNGVYSTGGNNYALGGNYHKKLHFVVSGNGVVENNYTYGISGFISGKGTTFDLFDSDDSTNATGNGQSGVGTIDIAIERLSITTVAYSNTMQSYANADNTFNTTWLAIAGTSNQIIDASVTISVANGWRYQSGVDTDPPASVVEGGKEYRNYTTKTGRADSAELGAVLKDSTNKGKELNYNLRKQPTLIIGYFVSIEEGEYQGYFKINSMAGLMLATYYYSMNFVATTGTGGDVNSAPTENVWTSLATASEYENNNPPSGYQSWEAYFNEKIAEYNANKPNNTVPNATLEYEETFGEWGYWAHKLVDRTAYSKFIQVKDISGVLTEGDIRILAGQWQDWSAHLTNFLPTTVGNAVTVVGAMFTNHSGAPFIGIYDGGGYSITNVNVIGFATSPSQATYNVGMFESVGYGEVEIDENNTFSGYGQVKEVNLRDWSISFTDGNNTGDTINVGGIIGLDNQRSTLNNGSFHGTINVYAPYSTVNVGGIVGKFVDTGISTPIDVVYGAIALGNIYVNGSTVNAGGIVGNYAGTTCTVKNVVSLTGIFSAGASGYIGGLIGTSANSSVLATADGKSNTYVTDSVVNMYTQQAVNKKVGNLSNAAGVSYSDLIAGSTTAYVSAGGNDPYKYLGGGGVSRGIYDVLDDLPLSATTLHESPRLVDLIKVYVLRYEKSTTTHGSGQAQITVYRIADSYLVGSALGTSASPIIIKNQQHVAYLREFRFATFTLANNVDMYTNYSTSPYAGAFYGTVNTASAGLKINLINSATAQMFEVELANHALSTGQSAVIVTSA
ncbi:MAG: hypothetical protein IK048_01680 [Clostridia bacterium]|nr:hypothetical protein [Clostridia bacterium]